VRHSEFRRTIAPLGHDRAPQTLSSMVLIGRVRNSLEPFETLERAVAGRRFESTARNETNTPCRAGCSPR
jgi:hypothetical protein